MSLLHRVKHLVGMGVQLEVELPFRYLTPGSNVVYHVTLTSEQAVVVRSLTAEIVCGNAAPGSMNWGKGETVAQAEAVEDVAVAAGTPFHLSGAIRLPDDAPPTVNDPEDARYWSLQVAADVPNGLDPNALVGFIVGPSFQFEWRLAEPVTVGGPGTARRVTASGSCTVVQSNQHPVEEIQALFRELLPAALTDLLNEQLSLVEAVPVSPDTRDQLAGALREIINPRIRARADIPLDSVVDLSVDDVMVG